VVASAPSTLDDWTERLLDVAFICPSRVSTLDDEFERYRLDV
jgi:hypothetical protein